MIRIFILWSLVPVLVPSWSMTACQVGRAYSVLIMDESLGDGMDELGGKLEEVIHTSGPVAQTD